MQGVSFVKTFLRLIEGRAVTSTVDLVPTDPPQLVLSTSPGNQTIVTLDDDMVRELHWLTGCWLQSSEALPFDLGPLPEPGPEIEDGEAHIFPNNNQTERETTP